jgi:hypothetical protein
MNAIVRSCVGVLAAAVLVAGPARSQGTADPDPFLVYAGIYLSDCADPMSPRLSVVDGSLVFIDGDRRITAPRTLGATAYPADSPTPDPRSLVGQAEGGQVRFVVHRDASGEWMTVEGDPAILEVVGTAAQGFQFRRCNNVVDSVTPSGRPHPAVVNAAAMLADRRFNTAYRKALGFRTREPWLATLDGPSPATRKVTVAGREYVLVSACKNHDCAERNLVLLWSPQRGTVYGKVYEGGSTALLGAPPAPVARELETLWRSEWRQNQ